MSNKVQSHLIWLKFMSWISTLQSINVSSLSSTENTNQLKTSRLWWGFGSKIKKIKNRGLWNYWLALLYWILVLVGSIQIYKSRNTIFFIIVDIIYYDWCIIVLKVDLCKNNVTPITTIYINKLKKKKNCL